MSILNRFKAKPQPETQYATITMKYLTATGRAAENIHMAVKLAKKQGVRLDGGYKHSFARVDALNLTITGPQQVVTALKDSIDAEQ